MTDLFRFALGNRRIQSAIITLVLSAGLGLDAGADETKQLAAAVLGFASAAVLFFDYFQRLGPRGVMRIVGSLLSMPTVYQVASGVDIPEQDAAQIAEGVAGLWASLAPLLSAATPNERVAPQAGALRNRNP